MFRVDTEFNLPLARIAIITPDTKQTDYQVLEIYEIPMMSMHSYPFKGKNLKAEKYLLDIHQTSGKISFE